ncbi:MAG: FAD-binding oxidoreductase [Candidatus Liptonbacteria bacterium]|nr:FAD-binding oxidoreductase [Candidatus Liptonbacteria bacterium]
MLTDELRPIIKGEVEDDEKTLEAHSRDYSIFRVKPEVVVFPKDAEDVKSLVKFVSKEKKKGRQISLTGRAAGTDMTGGPLSGSIVVNFTRHMNRIKKIEGDSFSGSGQAYAIVEPGVYFRDFEREIAKRGLMYPSYPASKELCAIGGIVMNNSGGEKTLRYGKTEEYVESINMVLADGEEHHITPLSSGALKEKLKKRDLEATLWRKLKALLEKNGALIAGARPEVSKNSSGYPLWNIWDGNTFDPVKLCVGSQGTLGLMTEVRVRLLPQPKHSRLVVIFLRNLSPLAALVNTLLDFKPESIESYDDKTLGVVLRYLPSFIRSMKGSFFKLLWEFLPEAGMALRGGIPKMVLLVELTAESEGELRAKTMRLVQVVRRNFRIPVRAIRDKAEEEKYWTIRRQSFALLHGHIKDRDTAPFIDDIAVRPEHLPEFLPKLNAILEPYKKSLIYTIAGHPGDGNFHIIPLMDLKNPEVRNLIPTISEKVYNLVLEYHGTITGEHNDGLIRTPYVEKMYGKEMADLFEAVKTLFDPQDIFNPGKKVRGTLAYALDHISSARQ